MGRYVIGVDLGGTNIKAGLVQDGKLIRKVTVPTQVQRGFVGVIANIVAAVNHVRITQVKDVCIGYPGLVDTMRGRVLGGGNIGFSNTPLKRILERRLKLRVTLANDARCFVMGEALYGAGRASGIVLGITLGTGVGGGIVMDKKLYSGRMSAGEYGLMTISKDGLPSPEGNTGCLEEYVCARAILRLAKQQGLSVQTPIELYTLAKKGNRRAKAAYRKMGTLLGIGLANLIYCLDPDIIVIGGQIAKAWSFFSGSMRREVKRRCTIHNTPIVKTRMESSAILGAAYLAAQDP